uniref:Uncharacterized protein n=1 Tax=Arundo donax TaxID=35708 RepID=A0A0A9CSS1_ARUDO
MWNQKFKPFLMLFLCLASSWQIPLHCSSTEKLCAVPSTNDTHPGVFLSFF